MELGEDDIDRWLERGGKFFKTVARNPVVRAALLARGLSDDELLAGWRLYTDLHGFGSEAAARLIAAPARRPAARRPLAAAGRRAPPPPA